MANEIDEIIADYERRALLARITVTDLCIRAGVAASTFTRWRSGARPWPRTLIKLDATLAAVERARAV